MAKYRKQFISITEYFIQAWGDQDFKTISSYLQRNFGIVKSDESFVCGNKGKEFEKAFTLLQDITIGEFNVYQLENLDCNPDRWRTIADIELLDKYGDEIGTTYVLFDWNENGKLNRMIGLNS